MMAPPAEPAKPSQDFLGEILGAMGCLPHTTPTAYPNVSELTASRMTVRILNGPSSEWYSSSAALSRNEAQTRANTDP